MDKCPICGGEIIQMCKCFFADSTCENGHNFHYSVYHKEWHLGHPIHSNGMLSPECCKDKIKIIKQ